jgi:hypothetical protein
MSNYTPDRWVVIKISHGENIVYKVFACWYGGYAGGDSWKMNSGITSVVEENNYYVFSGASGSTYTCHKEHYGVNLYGQGVLSSLIAQAGELGATIEIMHEDTVFTEMIFPI